jgi:hypothetical protein
VKAITVPFLNAVQAQGTESCPTRLERLGRGKATAANQSDREGSDSRRQRGWRSAPHRTSGRETYGAFHTDMNTHLDRGPATGQAEADGGMQHLSAAPQVDPAPGATSISPLNRASSSAF